MEPDGGRPVDGPDDGAEVGGIDGSGGSGGIDGTTGLGGRVLDGRVLDGGTEGEGRKLDGMPPVGLVASASLYAALLLAALRDEGVDVRPDPGAPVVLMLPPATLGELSSPEWSTRLDGIPASVPMVVVAHPSTPGLHVLAPRIHSGRTSVLDATTSTMSTIVSMLRLAADGRQVIDPPFGSGAGAPGLPLLSQAEWEVLELLASGLSNRAIAEHRFVAERTVETHVRQILQKLGLPDDPGTNRRVLAARMFLTGVLGP